ncbi:NADH oxidase [Hartmannibacter diazotrophicus]|uniref:NADH oxidase n=1 Tax=Hartmannibacter diazotrophicus TaxID=1482074 RepID=A0A2C9D548_9HYPH|nr:NADH:flavin oxidoreductase [Hartmannibacter diazotrophicus]SON55268.1 NADH oxidase [Hartmannibacter diazotrophicus]
MDTSPLFRPFRLGSLELPNRIVMAPMTRKYSPSGIPNDAVARYYRRRAEGGVGLIITEGTTIDRRAASNNPDIPNFHSPASLAGWAHVLAEVHAAGGKIAPQIWHQGMSRAAGTGPFPDAPSEGPSAMEGQGHTMSDADIAETIDAYASAAASARRIGFDAVELHGAHGYLIDQFFWAPTNQRHDRFGGDAADRTRFAVEVIRAVRRAIGPDFPLSLRFSQWKTQDYSARLAETPEQLERILTPLAEAGVDIFHASTRRFWQPEFAGSDLNLAGWSRKLTGRPSISVGSVGLAGPDFMEALSGRSYGAELGSLDELLRRMAADEFDLIAVGRALISNPDWSLKVREARLDELKPFERTDLETLA